MAVVRVEYGYDKIVSDGVTVLRIKQNRSANVTRAWMSAIMMAVVIMFVSTQVNNGRLGGSALGVALLLCAGLFAVTLLYSFAGGRTTVAMSRDTLSVNSEQYAKADICEVLVCQPGMGSFTASSDLEVQSKLAMRQAVASQSYYVTFNYGARVVMLAKKMTGPQASRVGSEVATWLAA